jgi:nicotinate phosphoribosyltransferase
MKQFIFLDDDLYKFSMMNLVVRLFSNIKVRYKFINRGKTVWPEGMAEKLRQRIVRLSNEAILTADEENYISKIRYYNPFFVWVLSKYRFDPNEVVITDNIDDSYIEGYWWKTILWECRLLSMISELYYEMMHVTLPERNVLTKINMEKGWELYENDINFAEFGTRRRFSFENHEYAIQDLIKSAGKRLVGSSNVHFAKKYGLKPIGTMAHEFPMVMSSLYGFHEANKNTLDAWISVYHGDLGIALPDTFTTDVFLKDFNTYYAKLYDGLRQDSGDPIVIGNKIVDHYYNSLKLDEFIIKSKTIVFSDNLKSIQKILNIKNEFKEKIRSSYGIGTWITNDIPNVKPLNIVIKISHVLIDNKWVSTVKLSDDVGKQTDNIETVELAKKVLSLN